MSGLELLNLASLSERHPGFSPGVGAGLTEYAVVCFEAAGHEAFPRLAVGGDVEAEYQVSGPRPTARMRAACADLGEAAEYGAAAVGACILELCDGTVVIRRSPKSGGGFDYFLIPAGSRGDLESENIFAGATARLEVSGTMRDDLAYVSRAAKERVARMQRVADPLPGTVVVVSFALAFAQVSRT